MKRLLLGLGAALLLVAAVAWSGAKPTRPDFDFKSEKRNPVTHLKLNNDPNDFQFAIVSDRTGGNRGRVFSRAIDQLNLMQPEFVISVGDLIDGYIRDKDRIAAQWREFQGYVARLQMPFFYVPGNHDITNEMMDGVWKEKFGRAYYEFVYRGVLFVVLSSEDMPRKSDGLISAPQREWLENVLAAHKEARWTLVFVHKPLWSDNEANGWTEVEELLKGRKYTVFAGHVHRYYKAVRQGMNYYALATTGGGSRMRGVEYGEFDHIVWVTMKKDGPILANVMLDGIVREDLSPIVSEEDGVPHYLRRPTIPIEVTVTLDGRPIAGAEVVFTGSGKERGQARAEGVTGRDGRVKLSTYAANDGAPTGPYAVTVTRRQPRYTPEGQLGPNQLPAKYGSTKTSGIEVEVKGPGPQRFNLDLVSK